MVEICNEILIKELWELKSKTCNTMWAKMNGCSDCKFNVKIQSPSNEGVETCLINVMNCTIDTPDKRKIKGVF